MPKMRTSFEGLVKLLAKHLYPEPNVFIRELIQNAHDSIQLRRVNEPEISGEIDVVADAGRRTITFTDNGLGMDQVDIEEFLATIGSTGTGVRTAELARQNVTVNTIGQFGIGLLSAFVVAEKIEVFTRKRGSKSGWHWVNHGGEDYELVETDDAPAVGTRVVVTIGEDRVGVIEEQDVRKTIKRYADFLPFRIMLNGNGPVNVIDAPWHRATWASAQDYEQALRLFLNDRYPDVPLHAIPVDLESPKAKGALYISDQHIPDINTSGVVDIFQERMCVRLSDQELLPDWAKFVRGVVDSPALQPTASRDNVIKNAAYFELRRALGDLIVQSLIRLAETDRKRFHRLCAWHHFHLKGMALHHEGFFEAVIDYLPFETNVGDLSLKEYVARQKIEPGKRIPFYLFSFDSNQWRELAEAHGILAINTGRLFDEELVRNYVALHSDTFELRQLDRLDDAALYKTLEKEELAKFVRVEHAMLRTLASKEITDVQIETRRFAPNSMSGTLLEMYNTEEYDRSERLVSLPSLASGLGELTEKLREQMKRTRLKLYINADNPLIRALSELDLLGDLPYENALIAVYNCAMLNAQRSMAPHTVRLFTDLLQSYALESLTLRRELDATREDGERFRGELLARHTAAVRVELTVDTPYETFASEDAQALITELTELVGTSPQVRVLAVRAGSTKVTIELSPEQAEQLLWLERRGLLKKLNIAEANIIGDEIAAAIVRWKAVNGSYDVFMCYNSDDKQQVECIALNLVRCSLRPWLDGWECRPGLRWQDALEKQIREIRSAAVFVGDSGIGPWQDMELHAFLDEFAKRRCPVIPVILPESTQVPELPMFLNGMAWVDFRKEKPDPMNRLVWGITGLRLDGE